MRTHDMIALLARDGTPPRRIGPRLLPAMAGALALSGLAFVGFLGVRPDLAQAIQVPSTAMKWLLPLVTGLAGLAGALHLTHPTKRGRVAVTAVSGIAGAVFVWLTAALFLTPDGQMATAVLGHTAPGCLLSITLIGLPALAMALFFLRDGASIAPARSGALAGLAAGGFAAAIYALRCDEDAPQFFLTWYSFGIIILATVGAALGRQILRW